MVSTRNILKDKSNLKMSTNQSEIGSKMIDSKCSMTLRKKILKFSVKENQSIGTNSKKIISNKKPKKGSKISIDPFNSVKKGVLTENDNQMSPSSQLNSIDKTNLHSLDVEKQIPTLKRPKRGIKILKESHNQNVSVGIEPSKSLKRKIDNQENIETEFNGNMQIKRKNVNKTQTALSKCELQIKMSKSVLDINDSGFENFCCDETNATVENLEIVKCPSSELKINEIKSDFVKKPNTRSTKLRLAKKLKENNKKNDLVVSKPDKDNNVIKKVKKTFESSSKSKSVRQTNDRLSNDKFPKQKVIAKTLSSSNINTKCESDGKITNYFQAEVLSEKETSILQKPSVSIQSSVHIPIYKRAKESVGNKKLKKFSRVSDVYNIECDEDMKNSPQVLKKKSQKATKKTKNSKSKKVVPFKPRPVKNLKKGKTGTTSCLEPAQIHMKPAQLQDTSTSDPYQDVNKDGMDVDSDHSDFIHVIEVPPMHIQDSNENSKKKPDSDKYQHVSPLTCISGKEKPKNLTLQTPGKQNRVREISQQEAQFFFTTSSPVHNDRELSNFTSETPHQDTNQNNHEKNMMTFLSEFEASFLRPQMTSTPDNTEPNMPVKKPVITKKHPAVRMLEITSIPPIKSVRDPCFVSDVEFESPEKIDLSEITLFESPTKDEDKTKETQQKKSRKNCQTKLNFGKSNKTAQKNDSEKITSFSTSNQSNLETGQPSGDNPLNKSSQRVLREHKKIVPDEIELSEDESDFEDDIFCTDSDKENARDQEKEIDPNNLPTSPVKYLEVLKPRKSYSPSVKPSFSRTKKAVITAKQYVSKEEKLIQSMNEHFSELDSLELCIE